MDWTTWGSKVVLALVPVVTLVVVYYTRVLLPKIPRVFLPILAALLPAAVTIIANILGSYQMSPLMMAVLGALATWLREIYNTGAEHGWNA